MPNILTSLLSITAAALSLVLGISAAIADPIDDRASELLPWVAQKTGYAIENVKVTVLFVEPRTINLIAYRVSKGSDPGAGSDYSRRHHLPADMVRTGQERRHSRA